MFTEVSMVRAHYVVHAWNKMHLHIIRVYSHTISIDKA